MIGRKSEYFLLHRYKSIGYSSLTRHQYKIPDNYLQFRGKKLLNLFDMIYKIAGKKHFGG